MDTQDNALHGCYRTGHSYSTVESHLGRTRAVGDFVGLIVPRPDRLDCHHGIRCRGTGAELGISIGPQVDYEIRQMRRRAGGRAIEKVAIVAVLGIGARLGKCGTTQIWNPRNCVLARYQCR